MLCFTIYDKDWVNLRISSSQVPHTQDPFTFILIPYKDMDKLQVIQKAQWNY